MVALGQVSSGYWPATLVGVALLATFVATTIGAVKRAYQSHRNETPRHDSVRLSGLLASDRGVSLWRCRALTAEALIVRQRQSGDIDAATYRARTTDLARQAANGARSRRNF